LISKIAGSNPPEELPSSFGSVLIPVEMAENKVIKEQLDNPFSVTRYTINKEEQINVDILQQYTIQ